MLEEMSAFFTARLNGYDEHMLNDVQGCREGYALLAKMLPPGTETVLDLGCGTGLELDAIFARRPDVKVTGIDLTASMLAELRRKHPNRALTLIQGDYFSVDLGSEQFDAAVSFQSLHHFPPEKKRELYARVRQALKPGGWFLNGDYAAESDEREIFYFQELERLRREAGLPGDTFYHYDTPLTPEHETQVLREAGFAQVEVRWRQENTVLFAAQRG